MPATCLALELDSHLDLAAAVGGVLASWATDVVALSIHAGARGNWELYDWPTGSPHHWRALLASRIGPAGQHLQAIELREEGEPGIIAEMRVTRGQAPAVCQALQARYPDLAFSTSERLCW